MNINDYITSPLLGSVVLQLITFDSAFKDLFVKSAPSIALDIESAAINHNCSCKAKISSYVTMNASSIGTLLYQYAENNDLLQNVKNLFATVPPVRGSSAIGRVAKTTIKDWPGFVKSLDETNMVYNHVSTTIVGEDVYVFFL